MKLQITAKELMDKCLWDDWCRLTGTNEWCVAEGLMDESELLTLTETEAKDLGLL